MKRIDLTDEAGPKLLKFIAEMIQEAHAKEDAQSERTEERRVWYWYGYGEGLSRLMEHLVGKTVPREVEKGRDRLRALLARANRIRDEHLERERKQGG